MIRFGRLEVGARKGKQMGFQLQIEEMPDYLGVWFIGAGTSGHVSRSFELITEHCERANKNKLLLNFIGAYGYRNVYPVDRYFFGEQAQTLAHCNVVKVAVVARPERVDPEKLADVVAQNRMVNGRIFTSVEDATEWLLKD
jgi:hypothetical protein